jgi:hypothetical protein
VKLPEATIVNAKKVFRVFDLGRTQHQEQKIEHGTVEVQPRWVTVIDCGSALKGHHKQAVPK